MKQNKTQTLLQTAGNQLGKKSLFVRGSREAFVMANGVIILK